MNTTTTHNTVFVVDDDDDFRDSLRFLLEAEQYQVACFESAESFLEAYDGSYGCLLLDVRMQGMSGLALQNELKQREWYLPVVIVTGHGDVSMAVQAMRQEAVDFLEKPFSDDDLLVSLAKALESGREAFQRADQRRVVLQRWHSLSDREKQVMQQVVAGLSNRQIGEALGISIKTVEVHRSRIMRKMQCANLAELVRDALHGELPME